jgi:hypothetical protein
VFFHSSCKRKTLVNKYPDFKGSWKHYISSDTYERIIFTEAGQATINQFQGDKNIADLGTLKHTTIKNNYIYVGRVSTRPRYRIDEYPSIATYSLISEYDTIKSGLSFMKLSDKIYVELK